MRTQRMIVVSVLSAMFVALITLALVIPAASGAEGDTSIVPLGPAQADNRDAYRALFGHLSDGGRAHWAQTGFVHGGAPYDPGTVLAPGGLSGDFTRTDISGTLTVRPSLGLSSRRVALYRSKVTDQAGRVAAWEAADVRETLDVYLWRRLPYGIVGENEIRRGALDGYQALIVPAMRSGDEQSVVEALGSEALTAIRDFVQGGGLLYAQGNGTYIAEAAGLVVSGTVRLSDTLPLDPADDFQNRGHLSVVDGSSPLTRSWLTDTLYVLNEPTLSPDSSLKVVAEFDNVLSGNSPAIVTGRVGDGRIVFVNGHPTSPSHRDQLPIFLDALLWGLSSHGELTGLARQTYDPNVPPDLIPAYEDGVPVGVSLSFANLGDGDLSSVVVTEIVTDGFRVDVASVSPAPASINVVTDPTTQTVIVWSLGTVSPGEVALSYVAHTDVQAMKKGEVTFSTGTATFDRPEDGTAAEVAHGPFRLRSMMAARLEGDRDLEADRQYYIPKGGLYLDVTLPLENKENTLADRVVITDVVLLIAPIVDMDDQETIQEANDGETIWIRNEPFFYDETDEQYTPPDGYSRGQTITLADWDGAWAVFDVPYGTHGEIGPVGVQGVGNFITIPPTYTTYITLTADHKLLLPAKVITWTYGAMPGYEYKEPALRYGIHSRELFSRTVAFSGDPLTGPDVVVMKKTGGSVYTNLGEYPIFYRDHLAAGSIVYPPGAPVSSTLTYRDIWSRTHTMPLRAAFYDVFSWASCGSCGPGTGERHVGLNVTFGVRADLDGDGQRNEPVLQYPSRIGGADLDLMIKDRGLGLGVPDNQMLVDEGIFHGLGIAISPRISDTWQRSWNSSSSGTRLVEITETAAYDHLYFQHNIPANDAVTINVLAKIDSYGDTHREGMLKLHDGARLTYRQQAAGPSRYELYDSHVQGVIGLSSDAEVNKQVAPVQVGLYGDTIYYFVTITDTHDPRPFDEDPYLHSYGFGNLAATTYVGGREEKEILHSIVAPGDVTRVRVEVNNNSGVTLTGVDVVPQPPAGITFTKMYTDPASVPPPIFFDIPFLHVREIPDASRGVYYFDVQIDPGYDGPRGGVIEVPLSFVADNPPSGFKIPPALFGLQDESGQVSHVYAPATNLTLTDTLPSIVTLQGAAIVNAADVLSLTDAIIYDDANGTDTAAATFAGFANRISHSLDGSGLATFDLPPSAQTVPGSEPVYIVAQAVLSGTQAGTNLVNEGAGITYKDPFLVTWADISEPGEVEAHGAAVHTEYNCAATPSFTVGVNADTFKCTLSPGGDNQVTIQIAAYNDGDYTARGVSVTVQMPSNATLVGAEPPYASFDGTNATWQIGDVGPGGHKFFNVTLLLHVAGSEQGERPLITRSDGGFQDDYSSQWIVGQLGGQYSLPIGALAVRDIYLPILLKDNAELAPDLVVEQIVATTNGVQVVIKNQGDAPAVASEGFWVDLYVNPDPAPTGVNQTWQLVADQGAVWGITAATLPLEPGASLTLTTGDGYYWPSKSNISWPLPADAKVYAQVDSANVGSSYGAVMESHEALGGAYNNVGGPSTVTAGAESPFASRETPEEDTAEGSLPPRP